LDQRTVKKIIRSYRQLHQYVTGGINRLEPSLQLRVAQAVCTTRNVGKQPGSQLAQVLTQLPHEFRALRAAQAIGQVIGIAV
jgi:hypothetical protein